MKTTPLNKQLLLLFTLLFIGISSVYGQVPSYYNETDINQTGEQLKTNLATLIQLGKTGSYTPGVWDALKQTDLDPTNTNNILLIYGYSDTDGNYRTDRTRSKDLNGGSAGTEWNREHSYPKSLGQPNLGTSGPGADIHHLRSSDISMNSSRGSRPYIDVVGGGNARAFNNGWYPGDEWKGDVARMMMYMYLRYGERCNINRVGSGANTFNADIPDIFLKWNAEDPVSQYELNRNAIVQGIQGNRNPFIDNPAFATSIWGGPQAENRFDGNGNTDTEAPTAPTNLVASNTTQTETTLNWSASTDNIGVIAYQIFNGTTQLASTANTTYTLTGLTANTNYNFTIKAIDAASNVSTASNSIAVTTLEDNVVNPPTGNVIAYQGYENNTNDSWNYTLSPVACNDNGSDVWDVVSSVGSINSANTGSNFFGIRDLEGNCGTADGGTLTFNTVDISGYNDVTISFSINVVGYDVANGDTIAYEIFHDNQSQGEVTITDASPYNTNGWKEITQTIPNTVNTVSLKLFVKQNGGSDYAGFDDVQLNGTAVNTAPSVLINEVDADQIGTDSNEFIELYDGGTGNTPLDGLIVVLYNGSNDQSYNTIDLTGLSTNANGYFVIGSATVPNVDLAAFTTNGIQNGADAVALYSADAASFPNGTAVTTDNLVDAFVYDTNDGDDAGLLVLLNDGQTQVNEAGAGDKDNHSSQRQPNGAGGARNTANYTQLAPTPGFPNDDVVVTPATIIINEVDADTPSTDTMEFLELYDGGNGNTSLDGFVVVMYNGSNDSSYAAYDLDGYTTNTQGYFVIGNADVPNVGLVIPSNGIQNGADAVALYNANADDFPNGTTVTTDNLVDAFVYDTNDGDDTGLLPLLNDGQEQINEGGEGDKNNHSNQRFENGTGGERNTSTYVQALPTPGAANTNIKEAINLIINEVDADTPGSDTLEFVELYDSGTGNSPLDGFVLVMYNGSNDSVYGAYDLDGQTTNADGYFVLGNTAVANVNMTLPSNGLQNGADAVALYVGNADDFTNGTPVTTANLVDALVYDTNDGDDVGLLPLLNAGQAQINEGELGDKDNHSNQRQPNGEGGARNTATYTQATPTPGAENGNVVVVPTDPISIADARAKADGELVLVTGVLTVADEFRGSAYIQDETGGIAIFDEQIHGDDTYKIGDSITVAATRSTFREQVQLGTLTQVTNHGVANNPIVPKIVTLSELSNYAGQLVKVVDPSFPKAGDMFFGNSNYELTDVSGNGQLRIDLDVADLVGLGQPENCSEVIGVVGRFFTTYQLLPRQGSDMACATTYVPPTSPVDAISKDETLDIVTWNIEWFGDTENSPAAGNPNADQIQKDAVKVVLTNLDADVIAVQEIVDVPLFEQLLSELPAYDYILSDAVSYPNDTEGVSQKIGFIYKKSTVSVKNTEALLKSIHPYYNGGDDSAISDFPNENKTRFYASGRLPFLMTADVTVNGETEEYNFVALHARANNNSDAQNRYNMRKYDVEVLKDSLDTRFSTANLVLLGDYNDDIDETVVADNVTDNTSTYDVFIQDTENYTIASESLTYDGFRSFVFVENMIDHITISNELDDNYLEQSERVHYEFYSNVFSRTTSDHFPVSVRLQLKGLELANASTTDVTCNGSANGTATIAISGGVAPYSYEWDNGATTATATNLEAGDYYVVVTDALGNMIDKEFTIVEPTAIVLEATENAKIYLGYSDKACATLSVTNINGGEAPYSYEWSTGDTIDTLEVCPEETTTYTVTVTDANGCSVSKEITVEAVDVSCGNNPYYKKVQVCYRGKTLCLPEHVAQWYVNNGGILGSCEDSDVAFVTKMNVYPNPFKTDLTVNVKTNNDTSVDLIMYNFHGVKVFETTEQVNKGDNQLTYNLGNLRHGVYFLKSYINGELQKVRIVVKR